MTIMGFDLATRCTGWCVGGGHRKPTVGVFQYDYVDDDLGLLARQFVKDLDGLVTRFGAPTVVCYEAPILTAHDRLLPLRKIYGMGMRLEEWSQNHGVQPVEVSAKAIKKRLTGQHLATKQAVVDIVRNRLGITLPKGKIEEDAADAFGAWFTGGISHYAKEHQQAWDTLLYTGRGTLV